MSKKLRDDKNFLRNLSYTWDIKPNLRKSVKASSKDIKKKFFKMQ